MNIKLIYYCPDRFNPKAPVAQKVADEVGFTNLSPYELKTLKKFCFDQEVRQKMVKFSINNKIFKKYPKACQSRIEEKYPDD